MLNSISAMFGPSSIDGGHAASRHSLSTPTVARRLWWRHTAIPTPLDSLSVPHSLDGVSGALFAPRLEAGPVNWKAERGRGVGEDDSSDNDDRGGEDDEARIPQ